MPQSISDPWAQIQAAIGRLQVDEDVRAFRGATTESLRDQLRFELCRSLLTAERWDDAASVYSLWGTEDETGYWFWSQVHVWREASQLGESDRALVALEAALTWTEIHELDPDGAWYSPKGFYVCKATSGAPGISSLISHSRRLRVCCAHQTIQAFSHSCCDFA